MMFNTSHSAVWTLVLASLVWSGESATAHAQVLRGGETRFDGVVGAEELTSQSDLWILDLYFKPMRQIAIEVTDPITGKKQPEYVWYIVYRAYTRELADRKDTNAPVNEFDPAVKPPMFVPEFVLVTNDTDSPEFYTDVLCPEALEAINRREKGNYLGSVDVTGPIPKAGKTGSGRKGIEGVAIFRGVNPDADRFTVYMTGFSNGIQVVKQPDGSTSILNKTIMQKYWRRGDRFNQSEVEIVPDGQPSWIYR